MKRWCVLVSALVSLGFCACDKEKPPPGEDDLRVCREAAERYATCLESQFSKELADRARSTQEKGIPACARDARTVKLYREACLTKSDCNDFLECTMSIASGEEPK